MSPFPKRFAAFLCALVAALLIASCASEPSSDVRAEHDARSVTPLTPATTSSSDSTTGAGKKPAKQHTPDTEQPAPKASDDPEPSDEPDDGDAASDRSAPTAPSRTRVAPALPSGNEQVLTDRRMVALYGVPGTPSLGALGEQSLDKSIKRVKRLADKYESITKDDVVPTFEIIATVASTGAGGDGDFSSELSMSTLRPWVKRAAKEGVYVVLDLQPGRTSFVKQAKQYAPLLKYPHVGLALDPEWRLGPKQRHLDQIGSVHAREVNDTIDWLSRVTVRHDLPQKLLVLHQFRSSMIVGRNGVRTDRKGVSVLIHADGQGTQSAKRGTWTSLHKGAPKGVAWGWKNFIDEDKPMLTPKQTYRIKPAPDFVSYQ